MILRIKPIPNPPQIDFARIFVENDVEADEFVFSKRSDESVKFEFLVELVSITYAESKSRELKYAKRARVIKKLIQKVKFQQRSFHFT